MCNINELVTHLQGLNPDVRIGTVEALAQSGDSAAVAPLLMALQDESELVRGDALQGLKDIGRPSFDSCTERPKPTNSQESLLCD